MTLPDRSCMGDPTLRVGQTSILCLRQRLDLEAEGLRAGETDGSSSSAIVEPFRGPEIFFGSMVEYHPTLPKTSQDSSSLVQKVLPFDLHCMREESGREICWSQTLRGWKNFNASVIHARRLNAKEVLMPKKWRNFSNSRWQMEQSKLSGRHCTRRA